MDEFVYQARRDSARPGRAVNQAKRAFDLMNYIFATISGPARWGILAGGVALAVTTGTAHALVIVPTFEASITSSPNAVQIEGSINGAINAIDRLYSNVISIPVEFSNNAAGPNNLLSTNQFYNGMSYGSYVGDLRADSIANPSNTTLGTAIANLFKGNDANGARNMAISTALDAMLTGGTAPTIGSGNAPVININSNVSNWSYFQPAAGGNFDLTGGLEHELDEVLGGGGAGSTLNSVGGSCVTSPNGFFCDRVGPLDLYRYSGVSTPVLSAVSANNPNAYFSVDGGKTNIAWFNQNQGGDLSDLAGNLADGSSSQCGTVLAGGLGGELIQNAFNCTGPNEYYTIDSAEFAMEASIGWDPVPEPGSLALLGTALVCLFRLRHHRGTYSAVVAHSLCSMR